jgi:hypothetical protein
LQGLKWLSAEFPKLLKDIGDLDYSSSETIDHVEAKSIFRKVAVLFIDTAIDLESNIGEFEAKEVYTNEFTAATLMPSYLPARVCDQPIGVVLFCVLFCVLFYLVTLFCHSFSRSLSGSASIGPICIKTIPFLCHPN